MNRKIFFVIILLWQACQIKASADVRAVVLNAEDLQPVSYACVVNQKKTFGTMADADGRFMIEQSELPLDSIIVTRVGYSRATFAAKQLTDTIFLEPKVTELQGVEVRPLRKKTHGNTYEPDMI